jgi:hypothetical protein
MKGNSHHSPTPTGVARPVETTLKTESKTTRGNANAPNFPKDVQTTTSSINDHRRLDLQDPEMTLDHGDLLTNPSKLKSHLLSLTNELIQREAVIGRYDHLTVQSYEALGDLYLQIGEPRAVVMHRAAYRINIVLYGGHCKGSIRGKFRVALLRQGVAESKFPLIEVDMEESMRCEMGGDLLRRVGLKGPAAIEYHKAARLEESAFGRENPDLAFLWRKIACLAAIRKSTLSGVDIEQMDSVSGNWIRQLQKESQSSLHPKVCSVMKRGDDFYKSLLYNKAVGEYQKAATMVVSQSNSRNRRSPSRSKHQEEIPGSSTSCNRDGSSTHNQNHRHRHRQRQTPATDIVTELKTFLQTTVVTHDPVLNDNGKHRKSVASRAASHEKVQGEQEFAILRPSITPVVRPHELAQFDGAGRDALSAEPSRRSNKSGNTSNEEMIQHNDLIDASKIHPIISRSKMLKPQRTSSGTSMYQAIRQYVDPKDPNKPKSDSYLTKLAAKTSKMAKKTQKKIKKTIASGSTHTGHEGRQTSESSLQSLHPSSELRPKSESYAMMDSPPMTPLIPSIADAKLLLRRMEFVSSSSEIASTPVRGRATSVQNSENTPTTANVASRVHRHLEDPQGHDAVQEPAWT